MSKKASREAYLLNLLNSTSRISVSEVVEMFNVSEATARRMFSELEKSGKFVRNYGGIQLAGQLPDYSFEIREKSFKQEKLRIGTLAAGFGIVAAIPTAAPPCPVSSSSSMWQPNRSAPSIP